MVDTPTLAPETPLSPATPETPATIIAAAVAPEAEPTGGSVLFPELAKTEEARLAEPKVEEPVVEPKVEEKVEAKVEEKTPAVEVLPATPEGYEIKLPESVTVDPALLSQFQALAHEAKLPPSIAQRLSDVFASAITKQSETQLAAYREVQTRWVDEINKMPEFTGEAAKAKSTAAIGRLLDEFGSQEVRSIFEQTGAGNSPAIVKMFLSLATALGEGRPTAQGRPAAQNRNRSGGQILYPNATQ